MQPTDGGRRLAINAVQARMVAKKLYDRAALADAAGVDPDTVRDFLNGLRWPRPATLSKIEETLGMEPGEIAALGVEDAVFISAHAAAGASAKTLESTSDVELLMELLRRATTRPPS